jgi:hypothetical protein
MKIAIFKNLTAFEKRMCDPCPCCKRPRRRISEVTSILTPAGYQDFLIDQWKRSKVLRVPIGPRQLQIN